MRGSDGYFNPLSWQLLWVAGLYFGYVHKTQKKVDFFKGNSQFLVALGIALVLLLARHAVIDLPDEMHHYFGKANLGLLRIVNVAAQLVILFSLLRVIPRNSGLPWLSFIGTYSIQVFTFHIVIIYLLKPVGRFVALNFSTTAQALYIIAVVASLSLPALFYQRFVAGKAGTLVPDAPPDRS